MALFCHWTTVCLSDFMCVCVFLGIPRSQQPLLGRFAPSNAPRGATPALRSAGEGEDCRREWHVGVSQKTSLRSDQRPMKKIAGRDLPVFSG